MIDKMRWQKNGWMLDLLSPDMPPQEDAVYAQVSSQGRLQFNTCLTFPDLPPENGELRILLDATGGYKVEGPHKITKGTGGWDNIFIPYDGVAANFRLKHVNWENQQ